MNNYYQKYLKYKSKYLNLKKQLAGSPNARFKYSINRPDTLSEIHVGEMFDKITEFESQTKRPYVNSSIRKVNEIEIKQNPQIIDFFRKNIKNRELLSEEINKYLMKDDWNKYFLYVATFNNSTIPYNQTNLYTGVNVTQSKLNEVFKDDFRTSLEFQSGLNEDNTYVGTHRKGFGNDNFLCTLKEIHKLKSNLKVLYLHAKGDENLVQYYRKIGFNILIENIVPHYNKSGKVIALYEYIMFGLYDDIIKKLEEKIQSNCDNLIV